MKIAVQRKTNVLVVDDSTERLAWFHTKLKRMVGCATNDSAIKVIEAIEPMPFDMVFMDHDNGQSVEGPTEGTFESVIKVLQDKKFDGVIVVHSPDQVAAMVTFGKYFDTMPCKVYYHMIGSFELTREL